MSILWLRTWQTGIKSLTLHPLRSMLTVLGIFIGVASVIWLLAIGEGISAKAQEQIAGLGADTIIISTLKLPSEATDGVTGLVPYGVTREDFNCIKSTIASVERAIPIRVVRRQFRYGPRKRDGMLVGCTEEYAEVVHLEVEPGGHFVTDAEGHDRQNCCVLAHELAQHLFPVENPIGKAIHVENAYYEVVGVLKKRAPTAAIGGSFAAQDFSNNVYVPLRTVEIRIGDTVYTNKTGSREGEIVELSQITLRVDKVEHVMETADLVMDTLKRRHKWKDYDVTVPLELLEQARTMRLIFIVFMGLIAAISLVVGGIGIMNIMLATVTERTREIGIRRALGAKRRDIVRQFLVETTALSTVGGLTGVLGGVTCGPVWRFIQKALEAFAPNFMHHLPPVIRTVSPILVPWSIPLAFGIAVTIGVIFGLYPARRAAAMDPIEALRHE
jgi:putative ABC transport system permease protein